MSLRDVADHPRDGREARGAGPAEYRGEYANPNIGSASGFPQIFEQSGPKSLSFRRCWEHGRRTDGGPPAKAFIKRLPPLALVLEQRIEQKAPLPLERRAMKMARKGALLLRQRRPDRLRRCLYLAAKQGRIAETA